MINIDEIIKNKIEKLRQKMLEAKLKHDINHPEVMKISLELDCLINIYTEFSEYGLYFYS